MDKQGTSRGVIEVDISNDPYKEPVYSMDPNEKKIIQLKWLDLFSTLIAKRYAKIDSDKCLNFITARDRKKHQLLEGILRYEKNQELRFLALPAYHLSADLLGLRTKSLIDLGLAVGEELLEPIVTEQPIEYKFAPALEEKIEGIAIPLGVSDIVRKEKPITKKAKKRLDFATKAFWVGAAASVFLFAASKLGGMAMSYLENNQEHRMKKEYQEVMHKQEFEKLIKGFRNNRNVFYTKDLMALNLSVKPGKYKLSQILQTDSYFGNEYAVLDSINMEVKDKTKPLMDPLEKSVWSQGYTSWCVRKIWGLVIKGPHWGVDISSENSNIHTAAPGIVRKVKLNYDRGENYGRYIVIEHDNGLATTYAHINKAFVNEGDFVGEGTIIATVGHTGRATSPHLHYEVTKNGMKVNPARYTDRGVSYDFKTILALSEINILYNPNKAIEGVMSAKLPETKNAGAKSFFFQ